MAILFRAAAPVVNVSKTVRNALLKRTTSHVVLKAPTAHLTPQSSQLQPPTANHQPQDRGVQPPHFLPYLHPTSWKQCSPLHQCWLRKYLRITKRKACVLQKFNKMKQSWRVQGAAKSPKMGGRSRGTGRQQPALRNAAKMEVRCSAAAFGPWRVLNATAPGAGARPRWRCRWQPRCADVVVSCSSGSSVSLRHWSGLARVGVLSVILAGMWMEMTVNTE